MLKTGLGLHPRSVHHTGLDPCVAFPFPALNDEVFLQHAETGGNGSGITVRSQPQVDTKRNSVGGDFAKKGRDPAAHLGEKRTGVDGPGAGRAAVGLTILGKDVDQVNIRGDVEFPSSQLSHAHDQQVLGVAAGVEGDAVLGKRCRHRRLIGHVDHHFGELCDRGKGFIEVRCPGDVARHDGEHHAVAVLAQCRRHLIRCAGQGRICLRPVGLPVVLKPFRVQLAGGIDEMPAGDDCRQNAARKGRILPGGKIGFRQLIRRRFKAGHAVAFDGGGPVQESHSC